MVFSVSKSVILMSKISKYYNTTKRFVAMYTNCTPYFSTGYTIWS